MRLVRKGWQVVIFLMLVPSWLMGQTDREFWFAAPEVSYEYTVPSPLAGTGRDRPVNLRISTFETSSQVIVDQPANPAFTPIALTVIPGSTTLINLTPFIDLLENKPADAILNRGLRIRASGPVNAAYYIDNPQNAAVYTLLGRNALGYRFMIPSQFRFKNYPLSVPSARNSFDIVATLDSTTVHIVPSHAIAGHAAGDTFAIVLNRGQTWEGRAVSEEALEHLGGTVLWANRPIAVTITDDAIEIPDGNGVSVDAAGDQLIPEELCGKRYIHMGGACAFPGGQRVYVYALADNTAVDTNGAYDATINRGEYLEVLRHESPTGGPLQAGYLESTKPVLVYNFSGRCAPPVGSQAGSCLVPPLNCTGTRKVTMSPSEPTGGEDFRFSVITHNGNQGAFVITGNPVITLPPAFFGPVPGTGGEWVMSGWGSGVGMWPNGMTRIISNTAGPFLLSYYDSELETYSEIAYISDFGGLNLGPDITACPGDSVVLETGFGRQHYLWNTGDTTETITVHNSGTYWVTINDPDCILSDTIQVSFAQVPPLNLGNDRLLCQGDSVLLAAGPGYTNFLWNTGASTPSIFVSAAGEYRLRAGREGCYVYDTVLVTLVQGINAGPDWAMCPGDSIWLDAGPGMNTYLWSNGAPTQAVWATSAGEWRVTASVQSCTFRDTVTVGLLPHPVIDLGADTLLCSGQSVVLDAGFCTGCTYQWSELSTGQPNIGTNQTHTASSPGIYSVNVTAPNGCTGKDTITITTGQPLVVGVTISTPNTAVCAGTPVTFTTTATNAGNSPAYQWKVNAANAANATNATYAYTPANGDQIRCMLTSSLTECVSNNPATSNVITLSVSPQSAVGISISATANPVCAGMAVTFIATPLNGGTNPSYQWKVNGVNTGVNYPSYTYIPANGDSVMCTVMSHEPCAMNNPAISNTIVISHLPAPAVSLTACF
ncbi:MAG TPA: hypothetical protein PKG48_09710, partial [Bacteroidales bacterium]|nr:hypothetical protein [Bacteroidales bacterium]